MMDDEKRWSEKRIQFLEKENEQLKIRIEQLEKNEEYVWFVRLI